MKMPVEKRLRGLALSDQTESDSLDEFPHISEQDRKKLHRKQQRAKKSRDAAQKRRDLESVEMKHIIDALPYSEECMSKLDKNSVIKLAIAYIKMKHYLQKDMAKASALRPQISCQSNGHFTKELHKNGSAVLKSTDLVEDQVMLNEGELMLEAFNGFAIFVSKRSKKILYVSESVEQHLGLQQVSLLGTSVFDCIHPLDHKELQKQMLLKVPEKATQGSTLILPLQSEFNAIWQEDVQRTFYIRMKYSLPKPGAKVRSTGYTLVQWIGKLKVHPSVGKPGGVTMDGLLCICHPLQSTSILEIRMDGNMFMSRHEMDMRFTFCDHRIATLIGYDPSEVVGKSAYQFHNPLDAPKVSNCHSNLIIKGTSVSTYYRFLGKNKDWVWLQTRATIIYNTNNKPQYVVCMNYVISEEEGHRHLQMEEQRKMSELTETETTTTGTTDTCEALCAPDQSALGPNLSLSPNVCSDNIGGSLSEDGGYESNSSPSSSNSPLSYGKNSVESPLESSSVTFTLDQGIDHASMDSFDMSASASSFSCTADGLQFMIPTAENLALNLDPPDVSTAAAVDFLDIFGTIGEDIEMMDSNDTTPVHVPTFHTLKSDDLKTTSNIMATRESTPVSCEMTPEIFSLETSERSLLRNLLSCEKEAGIKHFISTNCQDNGGCTSLEKGSHNHMLNSTPENYSNGLTSQNSELRSFESQMDGQDCSLDKVLISDTETFSSVNSQIPRGRTTKGLATVQVSMLNPPDIPLIQDPSGLGPTDEFSEFAIQYLESLTETEAQAMIAELGQSPDLMDMSDDYFSSLQCDAPQISTNSLVPNSPCSTSKQSSPMVTNNDGIYSRNSESVDVQPSVIDSSNIHLTAKKFAQQESTCSFDKLRHSQNRSNALQLPITGPSNDGLCHISSNNCSVSLNSNISAKGDNSSVSQNCTVSFNSTQSTNLNLDSTIFKKPEQAPKAVVLPIKHHVATLDHRYHQNQPVRFSSSVPRRSQSTEEQLDKQHLNPGLKPQQQQLSQSMTELEKILRGYVSDEPPIFSLSVTNRREPRPLLELFLTNQMSKEMYQRMERDRQVTGEFSRGCQQSGQTVANG